MSRIVDLLDLRQTLTPSDRRLVREEDAIIERVRRGLPYPALEALTARLNLEPSELGRVLGLPLRTLARRRLTRRLSSDESDRLVRLARIVALGEETLGSPVKLGRWLREPSAALGQTRPLDWLDTDVGARKVEELLLRISHGVHS